MPQREREARAQEMATLLEKVLAFADEREDYLLAAKLVEAQLTLAEHYISSRE